jgi:release factor glutamine methyltransferase
MASVLDGPAPPQPDVRCRSAPSRLAGEGRGGGAPGQSDLPTVATLLCQGTKTLRDAGVENPRAEARLLLAHSLGLDPSVLLGRKHEPVHAADFAALLARRAAREPIAYILGRREFWGMLFRVTPATLIPRPESETLIEAALAHLDGHCRPLRVLDLGTGSGCLLCAVLAELPNARGIGIDCSQAALEVARANAAALGLADRAAFRKGDWLAGVAEDFDLVLANPPYVAAPDMAGLAPELAHEPRSALAAGDDGLAAYRAILPGLGERLRPAGVAVLELGAGQADAVGALARKADLRVAALRHDLAGIPRAIVLAPA